jgi:hypothetical protein
MLTARPGCCEEAIGLPTYIPCNRPATDVIDWRPRADAAIRVCRDCMDHNVRNRGATRVGPYVADGDGAGISEAGRGPGARLSEVRSSNPSPSINFGLGVVLPDAPSQDLLDAVEEAPPEPPKDRLERLRRACVALRDAEALVSDLKERLEAATSELNALKTETVPGLMLECGTSQFVLDPEGNYPPIEIKTRDDIRASIAASWPEDRRRAAFAYLDESGAGDLIKTDIVVRFPREMRVAALELGRELNERGLEIDIKESVHHGTLSSWLKEVVKAGAMIPLDVIGGYVGKTAVVRDLTVDGRVGKRSRRSV